MKSIKELNPREFNTTAEIDSNLNTLFERLIKLQTAFGKDLLITSGLRSEHLQSTLIKQGKTTAIRSKHLIGAAADILDQDKALASWINENLVKVEDIGLWMEDFKYTKNWVHVQILPPKSGKRVFIP